MLQMYEEPIESLSDRLREAMYIRDVSAAEISRNTNISTAAISRYLHGDYVPKQDNTYALATYLRVNPAWLMGYDVPMERKNNTTDILTDGEQLLLSLFRQVPAEMQDVVLEMVRVALKNRQ
jgi:transcriptional regulator with XRE-family HTH domain